MITHLEPDILECEVKWALGRITTKKREVKGKGEKETYIHLNAEFQRIAWKDKKASLSNHCKEIEENNRMGKTRDIFKKIRDTKGTFHAKMGTIKDRNYMDLEKAMATHSSTLATSFCFHLLLLGPYHFCPLLYPYLHEMFPWYL